MDEGSPQQQSGQEGAQSGNGVAIGAADSPPIAPKPADDPKSAKPDDAAKPALDDARKSVEDAASVSGVLWLSYPFNLFYIRIAAGGVTHKESLAQTQDGPGGGQTPGQSLTRFCLGCCYSSGPRKPTRDCCDAASILHSGSILLWPGERICDFLTTNHIRLQ